MQKNSKIYVAGHRGLVGSALVRALKRKGFENIISRNHQEMDLCEQGAVQTFFERQRPDYVFLAAAKVGGIWANNTFPAQFIYENLLIQNNVIHNAKRVGVRRLLFLGSSCIYPRDCPQPIKESYLLTGPLEATNRPYAVAKIAGIEMCWAYNRQFGTQYLAVMPTNLYGPNDNYDLQTSHVLPALIRKAHLAKLAQEHDLEGIKKDIEVRGKVAPEVLARMGISENLAHIDSDGGKLVVWGTGSPQREFLYSDDMADACIFLMTLEDEHYARLAAPEGLPLINIGCGHDVRIKELAELVRKVVGFTGDWVWDASKPDGTPRKLLDVDRLQALGWRPSVDLSTGIQAAYEDYKNGATV